MFNKKFGIDSRSVVPGGQLITVSAIGAPPAMLFTTMAGIHQSVNLACALQAVRLVMEHDDAISEETMREGFARAKRIAWHDVRETSLGNTGVTIFLKGMHSKIVQVPDFAGVDREQVHDLLDYRFKWYRENSK